VTVNINLIFTLWHDSSVVHINLSTAITNSDDISTLIKYLSTSTKYSSNNVLQILSEKST